MAAETLPRVPLKRRWRAPPLTPEQLLTDFAKTLRSGVALPQEERDRMAYMLDLVRDKTYPHRRAQQRQWQDLVENIELEIKRAKAWRDRPIPAVYADFAKRAGFNSGEALYRAVLRSKQTGHPPARFKPR